MNTSRRQFLRATGLLTAAATLPRWLGEANAASATGYSGYRAAICVSLLGGNDSNNLLVPKAETPYAHYRRPGRTLASSRRIC
ncbi:twin-arginine translocation signal domain-containing protein [Cystobacter fuscus]